MDDINKRVNEVRKELGRTQVEFAKKIGLSQGTLSGIEKGDVSVTERNIQAICKEFNVNEEWLRTGEGEMFIKLSRDDELAKWAGELANPNNNDEFVKKFVHILSKLSVDEWKVLEKMALMMVEEVEKD